LNFSFLYAKIAFLFPKAQGKITQELGNGKEKVSLFGYMEETERRKQEDGGKDGEQR
jgi:hypothetical protein